MKKFFLGLIFLPFLVSKIFAAESAVENYVKTEVSGESAKVETNINTKVNQTETSVRVNQPGEIELKVENEKVEIKTGKGVIPTIIITGVPKENLKFEEIEEKDEKIKEIKEESRKEILRIYNFLKGLFSRLLGIFRIDS